MRGINYNEEIPFERDVAKYKYEVGEEENPDPNLDL